MKIKINGRSFIYPDSDIEWFDSLGNVKYKLMDRIVRSRPNRGDKFEPDNWENFNKTELKDKTVWVSKSRNSHHNNFEIEKKVEVKKDMVKIKSGRKWHEYPDDQIVSWDSEGNIEWSDKIHWKFLKGRPSKGDEFVYDENNFFEVNKKMNYLPGFKNELHKHNKKEIIFDKEPKILIATVIWKRHNIVKLFIDKNKKFGDILIVGSEGYQSRDLAINNGCYYIECPNEPFGYKLNKRIDWFLENKEYTHIVLLGSDNIISSEVYQEILKKIKYYDIISWRDIYFLELYSKELVYTPGYTNKRKGEPLAPGRCISRTYIENNTNLWDYNIEKQPDGKLWSKIKKHENQIILSCKEIDGYILDIKTDFNINSFDKIMTKGNKEKLDLRNNNNNNIYNKIIEDIYEYNK